jgi:hypothetical protein
MPSFDFYLFRYLQDRTTNIAVIMAAKTPTIAKFSSS